jgi:hypothetical protein
MSAIGFGKNVTGGGKKPGRIEVTKGKNEGSGTLKDGSTICRSKSPRVSTKAVAAYYDAVKQKIPQRDPMTAALSEVIKKEAGPLPG